MGPIYTEIPSKHILYRIVYKNKNSSNILIVNFLLNQKCKEPIYSGLKGEVNRDS